MGVCKKGAKKLQKRGVKVTCEERGVQKGGA